MKVWTNKPGIQNFLKKSSWKRLANILLLVLTRIAPLNQCNAWKGWPAIQKLIQKINLVYEASNRILACTLLPFIILDVNKVKHLSLLKSTVIAVSGFTLSCVFVFFLIFVQMSGGQCVVIQDGGHSANNILSIIALAFCFGSQGLGWPFVLWIEFRGQILLWELSFASYPIGGWTGSWN